MLRLNEMRIQKSITQKELAKAIGVKNYTVANWEQGRSEPSIQDLIELSNIFECTIDYFVGRTHDFENVELYPIFNKKDKRTIDLFLKLPQNKKEIISELIDDINKGL